MLGAHLAAHRVPVVLVLDCDGPVSPDVVAGLERVLRQSQGHLRVVILSRTVPPVSVQRLRLRGAVNQIGAAELAFRPDEVRALLACAGLGSSEHDGQALADRTHGWAAAVRLAALDATRRGDAAIGDVRATTGSVADYLRAEVLGTLTEADRRLLLDCSVVEVVQLGMADALGGPRGGDRLLRIGLAFVDESRAASSEFHLHPLVRELAYAQLVQRGSRPMCAAAQAGCSLARGGGAPRRGRAAGGPRRGLARCGRVRGRLGSGDRGAARGGTGRDPGTVRGDAGVGRRTVRLDRPSGDRGRPRRSS